MILNGTNQSITGVLGGSASGVAFFSSYEDEAVPGGGGASHGTISNTAVPVVPAPSGGEALEVCSIFIHNGSGGSVTLTLALLVNVTSYNLFSGVLLDGDTLMYGDDGITVMDKNGGAKFSSSGAVSLNDGDNIVVGTSTGTKIGTSVSQKLGFWNATPIVQPSGASQAAVAATGATNSSPYGYSQAQADGIVTLLNVIRGVLVSEGLMKGSA